MNQLPDDYQVNPSDEQPAPARPRRSASPWLWGLVLVVAVGGLLWYLGRGNPLAESKLAWVTDSDQAMERAEREGLPVLMVFSQPNCGYCRVLKKQVLATDDFERMAAGRVVPADLDIREADKHLQLLVGYGGNATPTTVLARADGTMIARFDGASPTIIDWLRGQLDKLATDPADAGPTTRPQD